ncbi:MAG: hypothetical protein MZU91_05565 [Desulfosudis oleivorans]|nr:hypothetical protein [Desulfosudis oleivorans]
MQNQSLDAYWSKGDVSLKKELNKNLAKNNNVFFEGALNQNKSLSTAIPKSDLVKAYYLPQSSLS